MAVIIGSRDTARRPLLIAEIGNNHEGDPKLALRLAEAAVDSGADAVKVQIIVPQRLVNIAQQERIAQLTRFRLEYRVFMEMAERVRARGALFMASVFDCDTLKEVVGDLDAVKIASGDLDFDPLLEIAARSAKPVILSTGMATLAEIEHAVEVIEAAGPPGQALTERLAVLHCVSLYPTPQEHANLAAIPVLARRLRLTVGYSDHTLGIESALFAVAMGARIVEKHFTLDRNHSAFRDHALSAEPHELAGLAQAMHAFDETAGSGERGAHGPDEATRHAARRSIVAACALPEGTVIEARHLDYVRPAGGLPPTRAGQIIGRRVRRSLSPHEQIAEDDLHPSAA